MSKKSTGRPEWPGLKSVVSSTFPLLATILFGFSTAILVITLTTDFLLVDIILTIDSRDVLSVCSALATLAFLWAIWYSLLCQASDPSSAKVSNDDRTFYQNRQERFYNKAMFFFLFGLVVLLVGIAAVLWRIQIVGFIFASIGAAWSLYNLVRWRY